MSDSTRFATAASLAAGLFLASCATNNVAPADLSATDTAAPTRQSTARHPRVILAALADHGFSTSPPRGMSWRQSRYRDEWFGQSRAWFGPMDFPNEAEVGINGPSNSGPFRVSIEAEIYRPGRGEQQTFAAAERAIREVWPDIPDRVVSAFLARRNLAFDQWNVEVLKHPRAGYTVGITGSIPSASE